MTRATPVQANSIALPLRDESVDLIITSPPYFSLRSYRDGGEHYAGQVGSEPTPQAFLEALWAVTAECWRVLKPTGSLFVNLGDKRSGSGGHNNSGVVRPAPPRTGEFGTRKHNSQAPRLLATRRNAPDRYNQAAFGRPKSKMLLPHRYAIGCEDGMADPDGRGWVVRQDIVWSKPNGLPESVTDRVRDSHEYWFHLTKEGRYFSAVDEVREPHAAHTLYCADWERAKPGGKYVRGRVNNDRADKGNPATNPNPLGKLPGSVWTIASEPLTLPDAVKAHHDLPDHFAAFPQEWPRRLILGWSPSGVCLACGEGRRPVVAHTEEWAGYKATHHIGSWNDGGALVQEGENRSKPATTKLVNAFQGAKTTITGYACACPDASAPTRPAVVCDVFGGTGTVAGVARQLGRTGVSFDLSHDYGRLAQWFLRDGRRFAKTSTRTDRERQGALAL